MKPVIGFGLLWLSTLGIALSGGWAVMYRVSYVVLLLIVVSWGWAFVGARTLAVERRARSSRAQVGSYFEEWIAIDNTSYLPKPWVEIRCHSELAGHGMSHGAFLGPKARRTWLFRTQCNLRGKFTIGDILCTTADPFGLFQRRARFPSESTVIVYPRTVDFSVQLRLPGQLPGGTQRGGYVPFVTPQAAGIRDYQPADPYQRIHWPSTARTGRLMVKEFELDPFADVWVVLDLDRRAHFGFGEDSTEEYAVTVAASLARHFLLRNRAVGLMSQGQLLPADRGARQINKVLEVLALVRANAPQSLADLIATESVRLNQLAIICVVTPSVDSAWVAVCQQLVQRGVRGFAALVEVASFGAASSSLGVMGALTAAGIPTYVVRHGEPLEGLLAQPRALPAAAARWSVDGR